MSCKFSKHFPYVKKVKSGGAGSSIMSCCAGARSPPTPSVQRVIIPQGLINPNDVTVIEIPQNLHEAPAVVAAAAEIDDSYENLFPGSRSTVRSSQMYSADSSGSASEYYTANRSPSQRSVQIREPCPAAARNFDVKARSFPRTVRPRMAGMDDEGVTYGGMPQDYSPDRSGTFYKDYIQDYTSIVGPHNESEETGYDYSDPERRARGFDPYVHGENLKRQFSQYMDFQPGVRSTPKGYQQSVDSYLNAFDYSIPEQCEPSYAVPRQPVCPAAGQPSNRPTETPHPGLKRVLDNLDIVELSRIKTDLRNFQSARRKLLFDTSNLKH